jgi:hypothetical protein
MRKTAAPHRPDPQDGWAEAQRRLSGINRLLPGLQATLRLLVQPDPGLEALDRLVAARLTADEAGAPAACGTAACRRRKACRGAPSRQAGLPPCHASLGPAARQRFVLRAEGVALVHRLAARRGEHLVGLLERPPRDEPDAAHREVP